MTIWPTIACLAHEILERIGFADHLFRSNISQYERALRVPAPAVLLAYARLANLDLAILIDDDLELPGKIVGAATSDGVSGRLRARKQR